MDYLQQHKRDCRELLVRIEAYIARESVGRTYFCRLAGAQIHALRALEHGTATPATMQKLQNYLAFVDAAHAPRTAAGSERIDRSDVDE